MKNIFVIGGGPAGITAAINAKNNNTDVTIIERQNDIGKKILVTGNGKCNYFNEDINPEHYHSSSNYNFSIINQDNIKKVKEFMTSLGIHPTIKNGYYYPHSNQAISILNTLNKELGLRGINVITDEIVKTIEKDEHDKFIIKTNRGIYNCDAVIFATGSKAYYKFDNTSYDILANLGHTIIPVLPALVQIKCNDKIFKDIKGVRTNALVSLYEDDLLVKESTGELQITDYGLSGICAMQLSNIIAIGLKNNRKEVVHINFLADLFNTKEELKEYLLNKHINRSIQEQLDNLLNYKLTNMFIEFASLTGYETITDLSDEELDKLCSLIIDMKFNATGVNDYQDAQVCSGGLSLDEVNMNTLESTLVPNLYFAGEVLDVDGDCGGYNLGFAWISGIVAGASAGEKHD